MWHFSGKKCSNIVFKEFYLRIQVTNELILADKNGTAVPLKLWLYLLRTKISK